MQGLIDVVVAAAMLVAAMGGIFTMFGWKKLGKNWLIAAVLMVVATALLVGLCNAIYRNRHTVVPVALFLLIVWLTKKYWRHARAFYRAWRKVRQAGPPASP